MAIRSKDAEIKKNALEAMESQMVQAAREDPIKFGELYQLYVERVFSYLFSRLGNVPEAEDATAQTFLAAFESFDRFRQEGHFASWLFSIARHKAMDHYRQQPRNISLNDESDFFSVENEPLNDVIQSEQIQILTKLIQTLSEKDRELLRLRFLAEMSFSEIAHLLHRNEEAVKKALYRLLARLHSQLEVSYE